MLKKKLFLPLLIVLVLLLASCATNNGKVEQEPETPPAENETNEEGTPEDQTPEDQTPEDQTPKEQMPGETIGQEYGDIKITPIEAFEKYMDKYPDTKVDKIQIDRDRGQYVYKVVGFDSKKEYELKIDPINGDILNEETETIDDDKYEAITKEDLEKVQTIVDKALKEAGEGARLEEWTVEVKKGKATIEVEMEKEGNDDFEYTYDVETGELVKKDD